MPTSIPMRPSGRLALRKIKSMVDPYQFGTSTAAPRIRPARKREIASFAFDIQKDSVSVRTGTFGARLRNDRASARVKFATEWTLLSSQSTEYGKDGISLI